MNTQDLAKSFHVFVQARARTADVVVSAKKDWTAGANGLLKGDPLEGTMWSQRL